MSKSCSHVASSWQICHAASICRPSALNVPLKRCQKPSGEKSGVVRSRVQTPSCEAHLVHAGHAAGVEVVLEQLAAALVVPDQGDPVGRLGDRDGPALDQEQPAVHELELGDGAAQGLAAGERDRDVPGADERLESLERAHAGDPTFRLRSREATTPAPRISATPARDTAGPTLPTSSPATILPAMNISRMASAALR